MTTRRFYTAALLAALVVAVGLSQFSSSAPDGLEYVAEEQGFADSAVDHDLAETPFADYGGGRRVGTAAAGAAGVLITLSAGYLVFRLARKPTDPSPDPGAAGG